MHRSRNVVGASLLGVGALALISGGAAASSTTSMHTLRFKSVQLTSHNIARTNRFINTDKDVRNGMYVGNDVFEGRLDPRTLVISTIDSFALKGGFIYATTETTGKTASGQITGGTGKYDGITGTVVVSGASQDAPNVTITYRG